VKLFPSAVSQTPKVIFVAFREIELPLPVNCSVFPHERPWINNGQPFFFEFLIFRATRQNLLPGIYLFKVQRERYTLRFLLSSVPTVDRNDGFLYHSK
jgi:hypothetical protein